VKLFFYGSPQSARISLERLHAAGHSIDLVITQPDRPAGRGKKTAVSSVKQFATEKDLTILQPLRIRKDPVIREHLQSLQPDLNVVVAYGQIMPADVIYAPPLNTINLHFSLLPLYRGASPVQWAILQGETVTGVTVFELNEKMDEGPILSQREVPILPGENALELEQRLAETGADLLIKTISDIRSLVYRPQDHHLATKAPLIKKEDGEIDWHRPALYIDRQVRAFFPWPSAFTFVHGKRVKIVRGRAVESMTAKDVVPGSIVEVRQDGLLVACGEDGIYQIQELHPENKKVMVAYAFSLGAQLHPGDRFASPR
jgi:methionyl-tRNA formyltransferase